MTYLTGSERIIIQSDLKVFNQKRLNERKVLGCGNYAVTRLYYCKESNSHMAGKTFVNVGDKKAINQQIAETKRKAKILEIIKHENIVRVVGLEMAL